MKTCESQKFFSFCQVGLEDLLRSSGLVASALLPKSVDGPLKLLVLLQFSFKSCSVDLDIVVLPATHQYGR